MAKLPVKSQLLEPSDKPMKKDVKPKMSAARQIMKAVSDVAQKPPKKKKSPKVATPEEKKLANDHDEDDK